MLDVDTVFNSTLKNSADLLPKDADLSCISSISSYPNFLDFNNEVMITAANYRSSDNSDIIANSNDLNVFLRELFLKSKILNLS